MSFCISLGLAIRDAPRDSLAGRRQLRREMDGNLKVNFSYSAGFARDTPLGNGLSQEFSRYRPQLFGMIA